MKYPFDNIGLRTDISAMVLYSGEGIEEGEELQWSKIFIGKFEIYEFSGGHFC